MFSLMSMLNEEREAKISMRNRAIIEFFKRLPLIKQIVDLQLNVKRLNYSMNTFHCIDCAYNKRMDQMQSQIENNERWLEHVTTRVDDQKKLITELEAKSEAFIDELDYIEGRSHLILR